MMDPNVALREIREILPDIRTLYDDPESMARVLADRVAVLDAWLTRGGFPPDDWTGSPRMNGGPPRPRRPAL